MILTLIDGLGKTKRLVVSDLASIPSIGHRVNMGYDEAPIVTDVIWDYTENFEVKETNVTVFMNDKNSLPK